MFGCSFSLVAYFFYFGMIKSKKVKINIFNKSLSRIPLKSYAFLGLLGMFLFSFDYIRLNGIASEKGNSNISLLGSFSSLFMPILLVLGLYLNALKLKTKESFPYRVYY